MQTELFLQSRTITLVYFNLVFKVTTMFLQLYSLSFPSQLCSFSSRSYMFRSANIQERVPHVKQMQDPDIAQCPTSQRYCDKMILSENITVHFMKMWKLKKCIRANKTMESSEKVFLWYIRHKCKRKGNCILFGGVGVQGQGDRQ